MASVTLTTLRARVREHADMVGSDFVSDTATSLDAFINTGVSKLHDKLIEKFGDNYFVSSASLTTVSGTSDYALPSDFYKLLGVDLTVAGDPIDLQRFTFKERNAYRASFNIGVTPRYLLVGSNLRLYPTPTTAMTGTIWYQPVPAVLVSPSDAINYPNGWEEFAILHAAVLCLTKEESDPTALMGLIAIEERRISDMAENRDPGSPAQTVDVDRSTLGQEFWRLRGP